MPRPKANPEQHMRAYLLWRGGKGQTAIAETLAKEFEEEVVSERTVSTWIRGFKTLKPETLDLDSPFQWHQMDKYGLPWESSGYLLQMWRYFVEQRWETPTARQMRWRWRVHLAATDVPMSDSWILAQRFVNRELATDLRGEPLYLADLEAHLAYRPWEGWPTSDTSLQAYREAVAAGLIPALRLSTDLWQALERLKGVQGMDSLSLALLTVVVSRPIHPDYPELLPDQQWKLRSENLERRRKGNG